MKKTLVLAGLCLASVGAFAQPASFIDLGVVSDTSSDYATPDKTVNSGSFAAAEVKWYKFQFAGTGGTSFFLDIDTGFVTGGGTVDTEIGLYDNLGNRIADNDDSGPGLYSMLSFGTNQATLPRTTPPNTQTAGTLPNGLSGALGAGTYWLAVGAFNTVFNATNWNVTGGSADVDTASINLRTNQPVPEPATLAALGLGAAAMLRRRKK